jgi:chromate reductase
MRPPIHLIGISGSLRKGSYNTAALYAAQKLLPEGVTMDIADLLPLPMYNPDKEAEGFPLSVRKFQEQVLRADAVVIATPEYDYSIPAALKNAMEWATRPSGFSAFSGKPAAIMGASPGNFGTIRAQMHLRQVCIYANMFLINKPEVFITRAGEKFDQYGNLADEPTRVIIRQMTDALIKLTLRLHKESVGSVQARETQPAPQVRV